MQIDTTHPIIMRLAELQGAQSDKAFAKRWLTVSETTWFRVTVWAKQAEACNEFLHKGSKVLVEGRLTPDPETGGPHIWESNGKAGASYEVTASTVRFLSGREEQEEGEQAPTAPGDGDIPF